MRFRLLYRVESSAVVMQGQVQSSANYTACNGHWKPVGGVKEAQTHDEALEQHGPVAGRWLVLCEDDRTWRMFRVAKRTETDIEPVSGSGDFSTALMAS